MTTGLAALRITVVAWLVALQALWPFLHAHAYGHHGKEGGFLHLHVFDGANTPAQAEARVPYGEKFAAQDGGRADTDAALAPPRTSRIAAPPESRSTLIGAPDAPPRSQPDHSPALPRGPPASC